MTIYAEDINYWKTSKSGHSTWFDRSEKLIEEVGGSVLIQSVGKHPETGEARCMLGFKIGDDFFRVVWPVLESKTGDIVAARRQAATMLYHDVKSRCVSSKVLGARTAFFAYLMLPDGRVTSEVEVGVFVDKKMLIQGETSE
ncbi:MAG: hypothetical protein JRI53_08085 [Deltaproteobacteria bacterium]|nr:hypothetical protein [Deltaproteobacteria bacterium]